MQVPNAKTARRDVPCNGCTLCCEGDAIRLVEEDDPTAYLTEPHPSVVNAVMIAHKKNGECIYLENHGCSVHSNAPSLCRAADCRVIARRLSFEEARRQHLLGRLDIRIWDRGHELLSATR
ncbi:MAG TPA: YkgJ family cysteine cluster protein [Bacteroidota bacterium]|nr:YkgJ family cysteine cluster protein [Bacteroidota bacterium]